MFPESKNKPPLTYEEAHNYIDDIADFALSLGERMYHINCVYEIHKRYGKKTARYDRNKNTQYYIIYDLDEEKDIIYVERLISNHITIY
jgi:hypothetical protein